MAHFKTIIRTDDKHIKNDGKTNIKIQLCHKSQTRDIKTDYYVTPNQFENERVVRHGNAALINIDLQQQVLDYQRKILEKLGNRVNNMPIKEVLTFLKDKRSHVCFLEYMLKFSEEVINLAAKNNESEGYGRLIKSTYNTPIISYFPANNPYC